MAIVWLAILIVHGLIVGWDQTPVIFWLLLVPFLFQDQHGIRVAGRVRKLAELILVALPTLALHGMFSEEKEQKKVDH